MPNDEISHRLPLPGVYGLRDWRSHILDRTVVVPTGDSLLVAFAVQETLLLTDAHGTLVDSLALPVIRRRGVPDDVEERMQTSGSAEGAWRIASLLHSAHRLSDGQIALVHADMEFTNGTFLMALFVSLLSRDLQRACIDERLPLTGESQPWLAFRGDTLFALEQVTEGSDRVRTIVRRFTPAPERCTWQPVNRW